MAKRLTRQGHKRKQQLMNEAAKLFAQGGYYATRVVDIVRSAGVAKGLFYWYFENKEALFREIVKTTRDDLRRAQARAIEGESDPVERLAKGIRASLRYVSENEHLFLLLRFAGTQERFASLVEEAQQVHVADTAVHIAEAIEAGEVIDEDPLILSHGVVTSVFTFARLKAAGKIDLSLDELSDFVTAFCLRALNVDTPRHRRIAAAGK